MTLIDHGYLFASIMTDVIITPLFKPETNENGEAVIECRYDEVMPFNDRDAALVKENGLWGVIDKKGRYIIDPQLVDIRL